MKSKNILRNNNKSFKVGGYILAIGLITLLLQKGATTIKKITSKSPPTPAAVEESQLTKVLKVIDGDTIVLSTGEEVRYIGVNTPEIENNECYATEASKYNSDLVLGKEIKLVKDASETDKYGRLLRYVYIGDTFINDELVKNGYAKVMSIFPDTKFESTFTTSEKFAKVNSSGLWGECGY